MSVIGLYDKTIISPYFRYTSGASYIPTNQEGLHYVKYLTIERAVGQSIKTDTDPNRREIVQSHGIGSIILQLSKELSWNQLRTLQSRTRIESIYFSSLSIEYLTFLIYWSRKDGIKKKIRLI